MKSNQAFTISGTGSALVDYLYTPIDFKSAEMQNYFSREPGDGGLEPREANPDVRL